VPVFIEQEWWTSKDLL